MFQRLTNLLFGSVIETTQEATVPKPGSLDVDDEGWLLVNASGQWKKLLKYFQLIHMMIYNGVRQANLLMFLALRVNDRNV